MEITSAATTGLRVALQVATSFKRPALEVYNQLRNVYAPPLNFAEHDSRGEISGMQQHRFSDMFFEISLVNIGGVRAENVLITHSGSTEFFLGGHMPQVIQGFPITKIPPGQSILLLKLDALHQSHAKAPFQLHIVFDAPNEGINRAMRLWSKFRKRSQYTYVYTFDPAQFDGAHVPSPEYNG